MVRRILSLFILYAIPYFIFSQELPLEDLENLPPDLELEADPEDLVLLRPQKLNINKAIASELVSSGLFSSAQIDNLLRYRTMAGSLLSIYELQLIPGFDSSSIAEIMPFITVGKSLDQFQGTFLDLWRASNKELQGRWSRYLEQQAGFSGNTPNGYVGSPDQCFIRMRFRYGQLFSTGLVLEKDRGEPFLRDTTLYPSFTGFHFYFQPGHPLLQTVALGNYKISFGQGLLIGSGLGLGKSGMASQTDQFSGAVIRPATSAAESGYKRGGAVALNLFEKLQLVCYYSRLPRDGSGLSFDADGVITSVSSLSSAGLHRTPGELIGSRALYQQSAGAALSWLFPRGHLSIQGIAEYFSMPILPVFRVYNTYYFRGDRYFNQSLDYSFVIGNGKWFGELAHGAGSFAFLQGGQFSFGKTLDYAFVWRKFPPAYQSLEAAPFAEGNRAQNESGLFSSLEWHPTARWTVSGFFDDWIHPWLQYQTDGSARGREYRLRLSYAVRKKWSTYFEWRLKGKEENKTTLGLRGLGWTARWQCRFHYAKSWPNGLEWRSRIDLGGFRNPSGEEEFGWVLLQDVLYRPIGKKWSSTARLSLFNTESWNVRFYEYENDLLDTFVIAPYYNKGTRFYFNLRFKPWNRLTLEARFSQTRWWRPEQIGSGLDAFPRGVKSQLSCQVKLSF